MLIVKVNNPKEIEKSIKELRYKVKKTRLLKEINDRKEYKKPSVRKRELIKKAIYKNKLNSEIDN